MSADTDYGRGIGKLTDSELRAKLVNIPVFHRRLADRNCYGLDIKQVGDEVRVEIKFRAYVRRSRKRNIVNDIIDTIGEQGGTQVAEVLKEIEEFNISSFSKV